MDWSDQQNRALSEVKEWLLNSEDQVYRLFGYAGTGKTTLAKHFAESVKGTVLYGAFTGKAAHVLASKGCTGALTIHQLIYQPKPKGERVLKEMQLQLAALKKELFDAGKEVESHRRVKDLTDLIHKEKNQLSLPAFVLNHTSPVKDATLVILDEASMINERMGEDLLSFGTKVLILGDPAQLPPVKGEGFFTSSEPDFMLTEIHRQAEDNPIIPLATQVRQGKSLTLGQYGDSKIIKKSELISQDVLDADQIIVGKNDTRFKYNERMRKLLGYTDRLPQVGEKIVCLKNNHERGLLNGAIWYVDEIISVMKLDRKILLRLRNEEGDLLDDVLVHEQEFTGDKLEYWEFGDAERFTYGYALTCHKSQGSQWDHLVVFDESKSFRKDGNKWLYTAITRAAKRITIIKM